MEIDSKYMTIITLVLIVVGTIILVFGLRMVLKTDYPLMVVVSESMVPTIKVGDIIVVRGGLNANEITAAPAPEGDMIVFRQPRNPSNFIIHRAIDRINSGFETKGDNNEYKDDWLVPENYLIGKVIGRLPLLGYLFLLIRTPLGLLVFITTILLLIVQEYISLNKN